MRLASVTAADEAQYRSSLYVLTDRQSADALGDVIARFDRAFAGIWAQALPVLTHAMSDQAALHRRQDVALTVERVAAFYGGNIGTPPTMRFDLLLPPRAPLAGLCDAAA